MSRFCHHSLKETPARSLVWAGLCLAYCGLVNHAHFTMTHLETGLQEVHASAVTETSVDEMFCFYCILPLSPPSDPTPYHSSPLTIPHPSPSLTLHTVYCAGEDHCRCSPSPTLWVFRRVAATRPILIGAMQGEPALCRSAGAQPHRKEEDMRGSR